jgi:uncharacterized membrane protein/tetratricopeptide (TPR) repeat protein
VNTTATAAATGNHPPHLSPARRNLRVIVWLAKPEWAFAAISLTFGIAFLIVTPPFQAADEEAHLRRAFEISEGRIVATKRGDRTGDELPAAIDALYDRFKGLKGHLEEKTTPAEIRESAGVLLSSSDRAFLAFSNAAVHPPLTYLPQALGIFVARHLSRSVLVCLYAGRALNLLATTVLTVLAIRLIPVGKWAMAALALTPMGLSLAASLSPDATTSALSFVLVAQVMACAVGDRTRLTPGVVAAIALLGACVGLAKQMYFFLPACYLLIPATKANSRRGYWAGFAVVIGTTLLAVFAWGLVVRRIWSPADPSMGLDPGEQFRRMTSDPVDFARVLVRTAGNALVHVQEYVGLLGWAEVRLPTFVYGSECAVLALICLKEFGRGSGLSARQALVAAGVAGLVVLTIAVVIHLTWDKLGVRYIALHGRYFIPVSPLVGIALGRVGYLLPAGVAKAGRILPGLAGVAVPVLLAASLVRLHDRYFVDTTENASERHAARGIRLIGTGKVADLKQAQAEFEESIRLNGANNNARNWLGLMLRESAPAAAAEQFRTVLRSSPDNEVALFELANILASQAEFAEAIRLHREALRASRGNENVAAALRTTLAMQRAADRDLQAIAAEFRELTGAEVLEQRAASQGGRTLKRNRGPVAGARAQGLVATMAFFWRSPPPDGKPILLPEERAGEPAGAPQRLPFFACSGKRIYSKRVFVFPPPVNARLMADDAVSWYYQLPLSELTEAERGQEETYRRQLNLRVPLDALPD